MAADISLWGTGMQNRRIFARARVRHILGAAIAIGAILTAGGLSEPAEARAASFDRDVVSDLVIGTPTITGSGELGEEITVDVGSWAETVSRFEYQWSDTRGPIVGATGATYRPTLTDRDRVRVRVTGYSNRSDKVVVRTSNWLDVRSPQLVSSVSVAGERKVGITLTAKTGDWGIPGTTFVYQWTRDGRYIEGATQKTYRLVGDDYGTWVGLIVTGTAPNGSWDQSMVPGVFTSGMSENLNGSATIAGTSRVGSLLTAKSGVWGENMNFSFQWLRDGEPIPYMSEKTYRLQPVDRGRQITVEIHGFARGYLPRTVASAPLYIADQIPGYAITGYRVSGVAADCNSGFESDIIRVTTPQAAQDYVYNSDPNTASFPIKRVTPVYDAPGATRSFIIEGRGCDGSLVHRKRVTASSPEQARSQYWGAFPDSFRAAFIDVTIP